MMPQIAAPHHARARPFAVIGRYAPQRSPENATQSFALQARKRSVGPSKPQARG